MFFLNFHEWSMFFDSEFRKRSHARLLFDHVVVTAWSRTTSREEDQRTGPGMGKWWDHPPGAITLSLFNGLPWKILASDSHLVAYDIDDVSVCYVRYCWELHNCTKVVHTHNYTPLHHSLGPSLAKPLPFLVHPTEKTHGLAKRSLYPLPPNQWIISHKLNMVEYWRGSSGSPRGDLLFGNLFNGQKTFAWPASMST